MTEQRLTDEQRAELADMLPKVDEPEAEWTMIRTSLARAILSADRGEPDPSACGGTDELYARDGKPVVVRAAAPSTPQPAPAGATRAELEAKFDKWWFSVGQNLDEKWPASVYGDAKMGFVEVTLATPQPDTVQVPK